MPKKRQGFREKRECGVVGDLGCGREMMDTGSSLWYLGPSGFMQTKAFLVSEAHLADALTWSRLPFHPYPGSLSPAVWLKVILFFLEPPAQDTQMVGSDLLKSSRWWGQYKCMRESNCRCSFLWELSGAHPQSHGKGSDWRARRRRLKVKPVQEASSLQLLGYFRGLWDN